MFEKVNYWATIWCLNFMISSMVYTVPQDFQTSVIMAAAQVKEALDNGAATRLDQSVEVLGSKFKNNMELGFGDAVRPKRETNSDSDSNSGSSSSSSSESESNSESGSQEAIIEEAPNYAVK
ncbi:uncharacterized protein LOC142231992 [Haematobia irritans]|uniref:uncharacterized protein LOC142231992 n=1 Tax=Haematobia irritans TaxID=7368 RepID=UPI003F4FE3F0